MPSSTTVPGPTALPTRTPWPVLGLLTAATATTVTVELLPSGLLPAMSRDLDATPARIGLLVGAWALTIAALGVPLARATMRLPRTHLLAACLAVAAIATLVTAAAPGFGVAMGSRMVAAAAHGLFWASVVAYVASIVDPTRLGRSLAIVLSGPTMAGLVGLPLATMLSDVLGWRVIVGALALLLALLAPVFWLALPPRDGVTATADTARPRVGTGVIVVAAAGGIVLVGHFAAFTYVATLVTGLAGLEPSAVAALLLLFGIAGAVGIAGSGPVSDRLPDIAVVLAAALVAVGLLVVRLGDGRPVVFAVGIAVWGVAIGAFPPILQARVLRSTEPAARPLAGAVVVTVLNLGIAVGATVGGVVLHHGHAALAAAAAVSAIAGTIILALRHPRIVDKITVAP